MNEGSEKKNEIFTTTKQSKKYLKSCVSLATNIYHSEFPEMTYVTHWNNFTPLNIYVSLSLHMYLHVCECVFVSACFCLLRKVPSPIVSYCFVLVWFWFWFPSQGLIFRPQLQ